MELSHGTNNGNSCPNRTQEMCASKERHQEPRALDWVGFSIDLALKCQINEGGEFIENR